MTIRCWARIRSRGICGDNGGVHIDSGIANKAFYELAIRLGGYAWEKAGIIWYKTLCDRLKPLANFADAVRLTTAKSCSAPPRLRQSKTPGKSSAYELNRDAKSAKRNLAYIAP